MKRALLMIFLVGCSSGGPKSFDPGTSDAGSGGPTDTGTSVSCTYPSGPYGSASGSFVEGDFSWMCAGDAVTASDLFDCDGSKGINAIVFDVSAEWCAACISEASDFKTLIPQYEMLGVKAITLMVEDAAHSPATLMTATNWKSTYNLAIDVCADPYFSFHPPSGSSVNLPVEIVVDPRTMRITHVTEGYFSHYPLTPSQYVLDLVKKNKPM